MAAKMAQMWTKFLPEIEQRVSLIDHAAQALAAGNLSEDQRESAHAAAHKLAGSLGLFGMTRGTEIARAIEHLLESQPVEAALLADAVQELRSIIAAHN
jgi:HPt (histidine-containing phosphotransfer) domain-containing protein